jgi:hypothetical protein
MTAHAGVEDSAKSLAAGFQMRMPKPKVKTALTTKVVRE